MLLKEAEMENSGVVDKKWGKAIFVSTSCRKFFRKAYPSYAKIRNMIMNQFIAKMFSEGRIVDFFTPKKGGQSNKSEIGEIREVSGGKFIGIAGPSSIRVIAVKGSPAGLPSLPQEKVPAAVDLGVGGGGGGGPAPAAPGSSGVEQALQSGG